MKLLVEFLKQNLLKQYGVFICHHYEMRQKLYQAQDEVDVKKENLLERVEAQLKQKTTLKTLYTVRFKII